MSRCELCGVGFEIPAGLREVTTCRILCPRCDAGRAPRSPAAGARHRDALHRHAHAGRHVHLPATGSAGDVHRRRVRERLHRQVVLGVVSLAGMLVLGALAALIHG